MTRAARRLSAIGALLILGGIGLQWADSTDGSGRPVHGSLAPLDTARVAGWHELARLTPDELASGRIKAIDIIADSLFVLQANAWSLIVGGQLQGTYGTPTTGAPQYLARAEGIARTAHGVAVLDAPRHRITMWSPAGDRLEDHLLTAGERQVALHQALTPSAAGALLTTWVGTDTGGHWLVRRFTAARVDSLPGSAPQRIGESFNVPQLLPRDDSSLVAVDADTWRLRYFSKTLALVDSGYRPDAPHFRVPAPLARRLRETTAMLPEAQRRDFLLAEALPSVRAATMTDAGDLLVLTVHDEESTIAELVSADGRPIATLWTRPDSSTMFAVRGRVLRVRELDQVTIIERLRLHPYD